MELSARLFGLNSWSLLVPQALEGVATVGLLYATVKRWFGPAAGLIAGAVVALTPVAALMFRYDNPDALLVLLLTGAGYATTRALENGRTRWLVLAMSLVGTGFLTKMLQAFLVVPAIALVYLFAGPPKLGRRLAQLVVSALTLLVASLWWVGIVEIIPARDRPYVGGSQNNNVFNLIFGYNGFGRITGNETGSAANAWGPTGWDRMFLPAFGSQISWLIPAGLVLLAATLWTRRGLPRTDRTRAAALFWGGWMVLTGLLLSYAKGIIHPYYTIALAPAIGAVVAVGATSLWAKRETVFGRIALATALLVTTVWAYVLLGRASAWMPELRVAILVAGLALVVAVAFARLRRPRIGLLVGGGALVVALVAPGTYTIDTVTVAHSGAIPSAGPTQAGTTNGPSGVTATGPQGAARGGGGVGGASPGSGRGAPGFGNGGLGGSPSRTRPGAGNSTAPPGGTAAGAPPGGPGIGTVGGAAGGLLNASTPGTALTKLLARRASSYTWVAATVGSNSAAGYQLATREPVMAIGGFNGSDPTPTLAQFEKYVAEGKIHYFVSGGADGGLAGTNSTGTGGAITAWVEAHFASLSVDGVTLYDLTGGLK
jgi:4-amino-4-deoxy-L-arabinose transferase-like glycosyltransferase